MVVCECEFYIKQCRAGAKALTGREERKVKSEKKWVLRTELIINHTVETTLAVVRHRLPLTREPEYTAVRKCNYISNLLRTGASPVPTV